MKLVLVQQPSVVVWFVPCNPPSKHLANLLLLKYVFVAVRGCCNSCSCFIFEPGNNGRVCNGMQWARTKKSAQLKSDAISCGSPTGGTWCRQHGKLPARQNNIHLVINLTWPMQTNRSDILKLMWWSAKTNPVLLDSRLSRVLSCDVLPSIEWRQVIEIGWI